MFFMNLCSSREKRPRNVAYVKRNPYSFHPLGLFGAELDFLRMWEGKNAHVSFIHLADWAWAKIMHLTVSWSYFPLPTQ